MKKNSTKGLVRQWITVVSLLMVTTVAYSAAKAPLSRGDPAPQIKFEKWLRGQEISGFEKGHVYVVEFWATWCGACVEAMPHLVEMEKKYEGKVTFISMDVREGKNERNVRPTERVIRFVKAAKDTISANVAMDTEDDFMLNNWLEASGNVGIPCSFVIDEEGRIVWAGHPLAGLDEVISLVLKHKLTEENTKEIDQRAIVLWGRGSAFVEVLNESLKDPVMADFSLTIADKLAHLRHAVINMGATRATTEIPGRYFALRSKSAGEADTFAEKILKERAKDPYMLITFAAALLENDPHPQASSYNWAVKFAEAAVANADPTAEPYSLVLGEAYYKTGNSAKAAAVQSAYLDALRRYGVDTDIIVGEQKRLERYEAKTHLE